MNIDLLAESIVLTQEETDFYTWMKREHISDIHLGQKVKVYNSKLFIVGGSLNGDIYLQEFPHKTPITKIRFDETKSKIIIHWNVLQKIIKNQKSKKY